MSPPAHTPEGFVWSGRLEKTTIHEVYATCKNLWFTGKLYLDDGSHKATVLFVAGDPLDIVGGDTSTIALWKQGTFRAEQTLPDLRGEPTDDREAVGDLAHVRVPALWGWIGEHRLSVDVELRSGAERAEVSFTHGHAERAQLNGRPEQFAALARIQGWTEGAFRVRARPLFPGGVPSAPAQKPQAETAVPGPRQFDVSRSIPMDLRHRAPPPPPPDRRALPSRNEPSVDVSTMVPPPQPIEPTHLETPLPSPRASGPTGRGAWIAIILVIVLAGGVGAAYFLHLPPFSPPPAPIDDIAPSPSPSPSPSAIPSPTPRPSPTATPSPTPTPTPSPTADPRIAKLLEKAQSVLADNHPHTALEFARRAEKIAPDDPDVKALLDKINAKLGRKKK